MPNQVIDIINKVAANPIGGTTSTQFPIVGTTTVNWGLSIGAYLLIAAAVLRVIGGIIVRTAPAPKIEQNLPPPPPPT